MAYTFDDAFPAWVSNGIGRGGSTWGNVEPRFDYTAYGSGADSAGIASPERALAVYSGNDPAIGLNPWVRDKLPEWFSKHGGSTSDPSDVYNAIDWGYRELQREKQKAPQFTGSLLGDLLVQAGLTAAGAFLPGVGPAIGGALGGALGGAVANHGDPLAAALGGVGGYFAGPGINSALRGLGGALTGGSASGAAGGLSVTGVDVVNTALNEALPGLFAPAPIGLGSGAGALAPILGPVGGAALSGAGTGLLTPSATGIEEVIVTGNRPGSGFPGSGAVSPGGITSPGSPGQAPIQSGPTNEPLRGAGYFAENPPTLTEALGDLGSAVTSGINPTSVLRTGANLLTNALTDTPADTGAASGLPPGLLGQQQAAPGYNVWPYPATPRKIPAYLAGLLGV